MPGWGVGARRQDSALEHAGGDAGSLIHGEDSEHTCASYTSTLESTSFGTSRSPVRKNTSFPLSEASKNPDSPEARPEEINATHPFELVTNPVVALVQPPTPTGSNSYTSSFLFMSLGTSASRELKNKRPESDRYRDW
jgi:hypothetical protein